MKKNHLDPNFLKVYYHRAGEVNETISRFSNQTFIEEVPRVTMRPFHFSLSFLFFFCKENGKGIGRISILDLNNFPASQAKKKKKKKKDFILIYF